MNKLTLISCYIVSLCLSLCFTYLLMFSLAFFFILGFTLLFRNIFTLLFWYRLSPWNLHSMTFFSRLIIYLSIIDSIALIVILSLALLFSAGDSVWHLNSVALLPGLIPAFVLPDCSTGRNTTVGTSKEKQESQHLHN